MSVGKYLKVHTFLVELIFAKRTTCIQIISYYRYMCISFSCEVESDLRNATNKMLGKVFLVKVVQDLEAIFVDVYIFVRSCFVFHHSTEKSKSFASFKKGLN